MSTTMTLDEAQAHFREVIGGLKQGDEITLVDGSRIVARIIGETDVPKQRPGPGLGRGMISIVADDDEHLKDFAEYMS
jgi:antitoxin (DNA-binding transcriptional repressor) of toxin-antitoxin stability system